MRLGSLRNDTAEIFAQRGSKHETDLATLAKMSALHLQPRTMIRFGQRIRLTRREVERLTKITGIAPLDVSTLDELAAYLVRCKGFCRNSEERPSIGARPRRSKS